MSVPRRTACTAERKVDQQNRATEQERGGQALRDKGGDRTPVGEGHAEVTPHQRPSPVGELAPERLIDLVEPADGFDLLWRELPLTGDLAQRVSRCEPHQKKEQDGNQDQRQHRLQPPTKQPATHRRVHSRTRSQDDSGLMGALLKRRFTA